MKNGKEIKLETNKNYNVILGTINNKDSKALYINISTWGEPVNDGELNYNRIIRDLDKQIRQNIYDIISNDISTPFLKERTIVDFDIKKSGVKYGKRSYSNCEITLFIKDEIQTHPTFLKSYIQDLSETIIRQTFENNKIFKFYKKKH